MGPKHGQTEKSFRMQTMFTDTCVFDQYLHFFSYLNAQFKFLLKGVNVQKNLSYPKVLENTKKISNWAGVRGAGLLNFGICIQIFIFPGANFGMQTGELVSL